MRSLSLGAMLLGSLWTDALAQNATPQTCSNIKSAVERLDCFDRAFPSVTTSSDPAIVECERSTISRLRSPSSYVRISAYIEKNRAVVEYDAQNGYGAVVRNYNFCDYLASTNDFFIMFEGLVPVGGPIETEATSLDINAAREAYAVLFPAITAKSDDMLYAECGAAFRMSASEFKSSITLDPTGEKRVYLRPTVGSFRVGECVFRAGDLVSHRVVR